MWKQSTLWKRRLTHLARVVVSDEDWWCEKPVWHRCNVVCWFYVRGAEGAIKRASKLTPNVGIDGLTGWLWVRSNSLEVCLSLALWIKRGKKINTAGLLAAFNEGVTMGAVPGWRAGAVAELLA